jgi:hypothetical protein
MKALNLAKEKLISREVKIKKGKALPYHAVKAYWEAEV